jgi:hypothetical protein
MEKIVWVLGAGFSRPLGGPLLTDLLTPQSANKLTASFPGRDWIVSPLAKVVRELYSNHRYVSESVPGARLWSDAEEFLTYLDTSADGSSRHRRGIDQLLGAEAIGRSPYKALAGMARRLIAAECSAFLSGAKLDSELWGPYARWARHLSPERNTILTFNYDRVPDRLAAEAEARFQVVVPGEEPNPKYVPVYKLHGSVDWVTNGSKIWVAADEDGDACFHSRDHSELVLATPGPTKVATMQQLAAIWKPAQEEIQNAAAIVFVGYRFPPSDAEARFRILDAIRANEQPTLSIHVVLGPDTANDTSARMRWMLVNAARAAVTAGKAGRRPSWAASVRGRL